MNHDYYTKNVIPHGGHRLTAFAIRAEACAIRGLAKSSDFSMDGGDAHAGYWTHSDESYS